MEEAQQIFGYIDRSPQVASHQLVVELFISQPKCATSNKTPFKLQIHYEQQPEFPLERLETGKLNWRVEKMKFAKDKTELRYNSFLTLRGIPPKVSEYRRGNRSAIESVVDQYQVPTNKRSGIVNDP
jgi:predicted helicase